MTSIKLWKIGFLKITYNLLIMKIIKSVFEKSSSKISECPKGNLPEFALVGRSNVGKSSLINTLLNKKEQFVNYKPVTVTPKKIVYDKLTINIPGNNRLYTNISNKIREIYPIKFIKFK